eukprot:751347-Hanusia_phi.AAC.11
MKFSGRYQETSCPLDSQPPLALSLASSSIRLISSSAPSAEILSSSMRVILLISSTQQFGLQTLQEVMCGRRAVSIPRVRTEDAIKRTMRSNNFLCWSPQTSQLDADNSEAPDVYAFVVRP